MNRCLFSGHEDSSDEFFSARVDIKKFVQFLTSEQVNPVKVVCNIVDDRMLALFLVHEDVILHCFLPAVAPWRICAVFTPALLRIWCSYHSQSERCVTFPDRQSQSLGLTQPVLRVPPPTSIRNGSTPLPRMAIRGGTWQITVRTPSCFAAAQRETFLCQ